jgi:uncharacterized membrane protein
MHWIGIGLLVLGIFCGTLLRLPPFALIVLGAVAIALLSSAASGVFAALLNAVIAAVVLQVGYAVGIVLRAVMRYWRRGRREGVFVRRERAVRLPPEQRHR